MNEQSSTDPFTPLFDRSVELCVRAQALVRESSSELVRSRTLKLVARRAKAVAETGRMNLEVAAILFTSLRDEVESTVSSMREAGLTEAEAEATVSARVRFVLYDGGFREEEAEPVVEHTTTWVRELYDAA
jgi:hypothetical protein